MKKNNCAFCYSLLVAMIIIGDAVAAIRVGNMSRSYANSSKNTAALEQQYYNSAAAVATDVQVEVALPVPVANKELAEQIKHGDENARTDMETLNKCAMIYPEGEFIWDKPTMGRGAGGESTCVAVVEMRFLGANGASEYTTVARGKLAAGDAVRCNISDFPESSYLPDMANVVFPADAQPTREDVVKVMNEEQKNKAGLKIAAAALVGGLGGNLIGKSEPGSDKLLGTNKEKMKTTAIGAAAAAALMTASTYSGKVAGDVILHTGVNAAAGGVIGNMSQTGDDVLKVEKCVYNNAETTCLWGSMTKTTKLQDNIAVFSTVNGKNTFTCEIKDGQRGECKKDNRLVVTSVAGEVVGKYKNPYELQNKAGIKPYHFDKDGDKIEGAPASGEGDTYFEATAERRDGLSIPAVVVGFTEGKFGSKEDDWDKWKSVEGKKAPVCRRDHKGDPIDCGQVIKENKTNEKDEVYFTLDDFKPMMVDAEDGGIIDLSNKARLGATAKGAGVGGAMGAFSGYQGAQADIEDRLTQATREYNDSLQKIYCGTGKKFLSFYNDDAIVPTMR